ncbi:MAG: hypothetical protein JXR73_07310 [Candidatus Omnitrophica bacterium]|nr:hypothetical protein [Candidatus Omnitrophota bacterium]
MKNAASLAILLLLPVMAGGEVIFEDDFMGENVDGDIPLNWQWDAAADLVWVVESNDVPEYGPGVMILGGDAGGTAHIGLLREETQELTDYRVTVLFVDRLVVNDADDADFHVGLRCQPYDPLVGEIPEYCYEVEYDGDDNDAANAVPEEGPTSFHLFGRLPAGTVVLDTTTREEVPRPVNNTWYWLSIEAVGATIRAKLWEYGEEEPGWQLEAEHIPAEPEEPVDPEAPVEEVLAMGGVRIGVWSGLAEVAYVRVETVETDVPEWSLY